MKMTRIFLGCMVAAVMFSACDKNDEDTNDLSTQDQTFTAQASMSNNAEIQMGTLALTKAQDDAVRDFAQKMITDHTTAQAQLASVISGLEINLSDSLGAANTATLQMLNGLSGHDFDTAYIGSQQRAHQTAISNFQTEVNSGNQQQLKSYASDLLPKLQMHLTMADSVYNVIKTP